MVRKTLQWMDVARHITAPLEQTVFFALDALLGYVRACS